MNIQQKTSQTSLKICGVTRAEDLQFCVKAGVDYVGLNFVSSSARYLGIERGRNLLDSLDGDLGGTSLVAVLADASQELMLQICERLPEVRIFQWHGAESLDQAQPEGVSLWKAFPMIGGRVFDEMAAWASRADLVLLDGGRPGMGEAFEWGVLEHRRPEGVLWGLAGGVGPENIAEALLYAPDLIDVASGAEVSPGVKNPDKIGKLLEALKSGGV